MKNIISTPQGLATLTGAGILFAATNSNIMQTGGYFGSHALLVGALSVGVFAGARVVGAGVTGKIAAVIIAALGAGEAYNLAATSERLVIERENRASPLNDALAKRTVALEKLAEAETASPSSIRLVLAKDAATKAQAAYEKELREGGRCRRICEGLKADAGKAAVEVTAAASEAQDLHLAAIEAAKADVAANPVPASATPLADRLGWAPWVLDLLMAGLLSIGANGLAGVLIAYGAHSGTQPALSTKSSGESQTDFDPVSDFDAAKIKALVSGPVKPTPPNKPRKRGRKADQNVINFTSKFRERHGREPSGSEIRAMFPGMAVSTAYDYSARARVAG